LPLLVTADYDGHVRGTALCGRRDSADFSLIHIGPLPSPAADPNFIKRRCSSPKKANDAIRAPLPVIRSLPSVEPTPNRTTPSTLPQGIL